MPRAAKKYSVTVPLRATEALSKIADLSLRDKVARLSHWMLIYTAGSKERKGKKHHWINIGRDRLFAEFADDYAKVVKAAQSVGIIEVNRRYSARKDGFSQSYRLAKRFHRPLVEEFQLARKTRSKKQVGISPMDPVGEWLASKLTMFGLDESAKPKRVWDGISAEAIRHKEHYALRCSYGRFHSIFTATSRHLRSKLKIAFLQSSHSELRITDIRNSQPLILAALARTQGHTTRTGKGVPRLSGQPTTTAHIHMCSVNVPKNLYVWLDLCEAGRLYEHLAKLGGRTRAEVKDEFLPLLFDKWEATQQYPLYQLLLSEFPDIAAYVKAAKQVRYQELARRCQRLESTLCIDGVCGRLMEQVPEIPLLTIHDSWIYPVEYEPVVHAAIHDVYAASGLKVSLSYDDLAG